MAADIGTGVATNVTNAIIGLLGQQLNDVMELGENPQVLNAEFARMEVSLSHIHTQFEAQQKKLPEVVVTCLERMKDALGEVEALIHRANKQRGRCLGCCLLCSPKIPAEIREWQTRFGGLFQQLESALSIAASTAQIVESAPLRADVLLQPLPEYGFVGSGVEASQKQLLAWLNEPNPQGRVIGVYGMAGVGKTALLRFIYNSYKKEVSGMFDSVIWHTVSQKYEIKDLQSSIATTLGLDLKENDIDTRRMKLSAYLENNRFLLILDDLWSRIDLGEVGVKFGDHKRSKVLISSRKRDVIGIMEANEYSMMIRPLSTAEGWELFQRRAFRNGVVPDKNLEAIAGEIASECRGLPLAINTVAAALAWKKSVDEWNSALTMMRNVDPAFPTTHPSIDQELYQPLRWSYNDLQDHNLQMCFLYCAAFPEDAEIDVETLVEMWTAEGFIIKKGKTYFMDVGRKCMDILVERCLVEYLDARKKEIKVHDVLRDMAIYIGQGEENWLFLASQHLQNFPDEETTGDCKRISVVDNEIRDLRATDLKCPTLVSLVLARNEQLEEIPEQFLANFTSLKVLDLSQTRIKELPTSVGQLVHLEFLNLEGCDMLEALPASICNLSHLQFLNLEDCRRLLSLPERIGELKNLKHLKFDSYCGRIKVNPHQISQLTSLSKLVLPSLVTQMKLEDFTNMSNLIELNAQVKHEIKGSSMSTWSEMRKLTLWFDVEDENREDAALDILPQSMQCMKKLQHLELVRYLGVSLPNCICQFQNLNYLSLANCSKLKELPALESGSDAASGGFPMLEKLDLHFLHSLESIVWNEGTWLNLRLLDIAGCDKLKELFIRRGSLPNVGVIISAGFTEFRECCSTIECVE